MNLTLVIFMIGASLTVLSCKPDSQGIEPTENRQLNNDNKVVIDTSCVDNMERLKDYNYCFEQYPELLYLVQKNYPNAALAAFKAAYQLQKTDGNFETEIQNLVTYAFYASGNDMSAWDGLSNEEKKVVFLLIDKEQPMDWTSVKGRYHFRH